ncbi:DUF488 domain-containing protein [Ammonicoccus fulvus]|uniref:DUF488 domain-containing protein n=1 Tax=Ammonicoccus fulvus TaxID=3138240 RepID=A0ABZ3FJS9_9ACTN
MRIHTLGHGTLSEDEFIELARSVELAEVVDVRSFPGSRRNPQFGKELMAEWLPEAGIAYAWVEALGGRRKPVPDSKHTTLRHESFRAYADHMETELFREGIDDLLARGDGRAVMCSEAVWWRCHRRLLADYLLLVHEVEVVHLMHDGRHTEHTPTEGVRLVAGRLVYDG